MRILFLLTAAAGLAAGTYAAQMTIAWSGNGSGVIGSTPFTSTDFTITATVETDDWVAIPSPAYLISNVTTEVSINGVGNYIFTPTLKSYFHSNFGGIYLLNSNSYDLIQANMNPSFVGWDRVTSRGPATDTGKLLQWGSGVQTDGGLLDFNDVSLNLTVAAAVVNDTPEPASMLLLGAGLLSVSLVKARRARRGRRER